MSKSDIKRQGILEAAYRLFREQGFNKTSITQITETAGGSKATIYSHFPSKEELFVECMLGAAENYVKGTLSLLDASRGDCATVLHEFGVRLLEFVCTPEQLEVRRLMIAEAARSGTGVLFFKKIVALRARLAAYLETCMQAGALRHADAELAAEHFGALLEAELLEPLLLKVRVLSPHDAELARAATRAVDAFLRAYAATPAGADSRREHPALERARRPRQRRVGEARSPAGAGELEAAAALKRRQG